MRSTSAPTSCGSLEDGKPNCTGPFKEAISRVPQLWGISAFSAWALPTLGEDVLLSCLEESLLEARGPSGGSSELPILLSLSMYRI